MERKRPRPGYVCKKCGSDQHFFKDCPNVTILDRLQPYVCHICNQPGHKIQDCPQKPSKSSPQLCWFCLANPAIRKHLIINIGEEVYLTLAKGGIIPEHFIIIPIEHHSSTKALEEATLNELKCMLKSINVFDDKTFVIFCHRQNAAHHLHIQVVAIPKERSVEFMNFAKEFATQKGFAFEPSDWTNFKSDSHSFVLGIDGDLLLHVIAENSFFPTSFGRELVANFLNLSDRLDWKLSPLSEDEEKQLVCRFKMLMKV